MKRLAGCTLILLCATLVGVSAQDDVSARAEIVGLERAWNKAYQDGDARAVVSLFDDSLVVIEGDGSIKTKSQYLASIHKHAPNQEQASIEELNVYVFEKTAVAVGQLLVKSRHGEKSSFHRERFIDTWIQKKGMWVLIASDSTPIAPNLS